MSSSTPSIFTGSSTFSNDFAQVITRAQKIASLPISLLTNQQTSLTAEQTALNSLSAAFTSLQASVTALGSAASGSNMTVTCSENSVAAATAGAGVLHGVYGLDVVDAGSLASATSAAAGAATVTDPAKTSISSAGSFTLHANGKLFEFITPASNTLNSLADAINTAAKGEAHVTIVNLGTADAPSYQLSIQNTKYGALAITLDDGQGGPNLLGSPTSASSVQYRINGQPPAPAEPLASDMRALTIAPNLTVSVLQNGTTDIAVTQSTASIAGPLASFVKSYAAAVAALDGQRGTSGGALAGQSILNTLSQSLRDITNYTGGGSVTLADLGLTFDKTTYALTFDAAALSATGAKGLKGVTDFLGSTKTGGFLKVANDILNGITDSLSGVIPTALLGVTGEISETGKQISENQARVDQMTDNLNARMAAADALIASMQQQATYFTNMFAAMSANQSSTR